MLARKLISVVLSVLSIKFLYKIISRVNLSLHFSVFPWGIFKELMENAYYEKACIDFKIFSTKINLSIQLKKFFFLCLKERKRNKDFFFQLVHFLNDCNSQDQVRPKSGAWNPMRILPVGRRGPSTWAITPCLPGALRGEALQHKMQASQAPMGCITMTTPYHVHLNILKNLRTSNTAHSF